MEEEFLEYKLGPCIQLKLKLWTTLPYFTKVLPLATCVNLWGKYNTK